MAYGIWYIVYGMGMGSVLVRRLITGCLRFGSWGSVRVSWLLHVKPAELRHQL